MATFTQVYGHPVLVAHDVPLAPRTTLGLGGPARRFVRVEDVADLQEALAIATAANDRVLVLGGGSNLVVRDEGFHGLVIEMAIPGVTIRLHDDFAVVSAFAGVVWDDFVRRP